MAVTWPRAAAIALVILLATMSSVAKPQVVFDLPDRIECRDVTPPDFAACDTHKVIEGKFRISARFVAGSEENIVDFLYILANSARTMRIQDYLPNTTLESNVADDQIEVTDKTERTSTLNSDVHVGYKILSAGVGHTQGINKTESSQYKQIAPKALVVASGTTDREHGVFFKLSPSKLARLEGAKEFTFLAIVPKRWRADWCTISCAARSNRRFLMSEKIVPVGAEQAQVGLCLAGDKLATQLVDQLRDVQDTYSELLSYQLDHHHDSFVDAMYEAITPQSQSICTTVLCGVFKCSDQAPEDPDSVQDALNDAHQAVVNAQNRLRSLAE